jgi:hypothetical protein
MSHVECDYSCLHPNIALKLYGGTKEYITHAGVAKSSGVDFNLVKLEHLSFFNKNVWQMKQSPLWEYYTKQEPKMMNNIVSEKKSSIYGYKETSRRMFFKEVEIMTEVIQTLNVEGIYVGYVYDALFCEPNHAGRVKEIMDKTVLAHGVKTVAKLSNDKIPLIVAEKIDLLSDESISIDSIPLRIHFSEVNNNSSAKGKVLEMISKNQAPKFVDAIINFDDGTQFEEKVALIYGGNPPKQKYIMQRFVNAGMVG